MTSDGLLAARVEVQVRSAEDKPADGTMTGFDGSNELRILRPGQYYLGINLNQTPTKDTPYPRWFYPGTENPALAVRIDFFGKTRDPNLRVHSARPPACARHRGHCVKS
jgi:hypothetical protein